MIVDGGGLLATAFRAYADSTVPGVVFARGVSDSTSLDPDSYRRELKLLQAATTSALLLREPIVYFCGAPIYGTFESACREDDELRPQTRYGRHQQEAERAIRASGASYLIVRTSNAVGPGGHPNQLIPGLVRQVAAGSVQVQPGASRDLLDVEDLVLLTQRLLSLGVRDTIVNVATGISTPVDVIVRRIAEILAVKAEITQGPSGERQRFDVARLNSLVGPLPFKPAYPYQTLDRYVPGLAMNLRTASQIDLDAVRPRRQ